MDDMRNTSAPLYGKAEPATTKTTMSVREMRQLLGLGKTDSYWLLHKNLFEVILINDKRRIVISSFEKWYANQVKYHISPYTYINSDSFPIGKTAAVCF